MSENKKYEPAVEKMLEEFRRDARNECGWVSQIATSSHPYPLVQSTAEPWLVRQMARSNDPWNPLWQDEKYAANTKWKGIIAPPMFVRMLTHGSGAWVSLKAQPGITLGARFLGITWEFFKNVRVGDSFRAWRNMPEAIDVTEENGPLTFKLRAHDITFFNQNNEKVARYVRWFENTVYKDNTEHRPMHDVATPPGEYKYSDDQIKNIHALEESEVIRGNIPRYWEDVNVGDELIPVVMGPLTEWDLMVHLLTIPVPFYPMRKYVEEGIDGVPDKETNYYSHHLCCHLADRFHKQSGMADKAALVSSAGESFFARLITNWMGDDAFIKALEWKMNGLTLRGDTLKAQGKVVRKYQCNDEYYVDLEIWDTSLINDTLMHTGTATVRLPSINCENQFADL